jgi:hypothetical protein
MNKNFYGNSAKFIEQSLQRCYLTDVDRQLIREYTKRIDNDLTRAQKVSALVVWRQYLPQYDMLTLDSVMVDHTRGSRFVVLLPAVGDYYGC